MKRNNRVYRKIWESTYGPIPKDEKGRSLEIHHIDGNHYNNDINNLKLVTIDEHYRIHFEQGDYGACNQILLRMHNDANELSKAISESNKLRVGEKNPFYGKHHTAETKAYLSKINSIKKTPHSADTKNKISKGLKEYERTKEHSENLRLSKRGELYLDKVRKPIIAFGEKFDSIKSAKERFGHSAIWRGLKDPDNKEVYYVH